MDVDAFAQAKEWLFFLLATFAGACTALEPRSSVWTLAAFGAAFSAFRGRQPSAWAGLGRWIGGTFFAVAFTVGVDHFDPMAEAFLIGFVSAEATKVFIENAGSWFGGILSGRMTGGQRAP